MSYIPLILKFSSLIPFGAILLFLYKKNNKYYYLTEEFKEKLPRPQNKAQSLTEEQIVKHNFPRHINIVDVSTHKTTITEKDLDVFYNKLNNFDYSWVLFK